MPSALRYRRRIHWSDTDASNAWSFTATLRYVEEAEVVLLRTAGVLEHLYGQLPRIYVEARYRRPCWFDEEVEVLLHLVKLGTSSLHYEWTIRQNPQNRQRGEVAAEGRMGAAFASNGAVTPLPDHVRASLERFLSESSNA